MARILTALPAGVIVLGGDGVIQQSNAAVAKLLGKPLEGQVWATVMLGQPFTVGSTIDKSSLSLSKTYGASIL